MRKPKGINTGVKRGEVRVYADFDRHESDCCVYVGGSYYNESAQIHLTEADVHALATFLAKASAYLKAKKQRGHRVPRASSLSEEK